MRSRGVESAESRKDVDIVVVWSGGSRCRRLYGCGGRVKCAENAEKCSRMGGTTYRNHDITDYFIMFCLKKTVKVLPVKKKALPLQSQFSGVDTSNDKMYAQVAEW